MNAPKIPTFQLKNGLTIIPTSPSHGARFSDGTVYEPSAEEKEAIKAHWSVLNVERGFKPIVTALPGIGVSESTQTPTAAGLAKLDEIVKQYPSALILVSFMFVSALREAGIRDKYPTVLCTNSTPETSRSAPADKVWDINNFAY